MLLRHPRLPFRHRTTKVRSEGIEPLVTTRSFNDTCFTDRQTGTPQIKRKVRELNPQGCLGSSVFKTVAVANRLDLP